MDQNLNLPEFFLWSETEEHICVCLYVYMYIYIYKSQYVLAV